MINICAVIGRGQMEVFDAHVTLRRAMHQFYQDVFASIEGVFVFSAPNSNYFANYWLSSILVHPDFTNGKTRENLRLFLDH